MNVLTPPTPYFGRGGGGNLDPESKFRHDIIDFFSKMVELKTFLFSNLCRKVILMSKLSVFGRIHINHFLRSQFFIKENTYMSIYIYLYTYVYMSIRICLENLIYIALVHLIFCTIHTMYSQYMLTTRHNLGKKI